MVMRIHYNVVPAGQQELALPTTARLLSDVNVQDAAGLLTLLQDERVMTEGSTAWVRVPTSLGPRWMKLKHSSALPATEDLEVLIELGVVAAGLMPMTARAAILRPLQPMSVRSSPRRSSSKATATRSRTYTQLQSWAGFDGLLAALRGRLDDTAARYNPIILPGHVSVQGFAPAAEESEVRAPLTLIAALVNSVGTDMGFKAELVGGGSNRSASSTDWIVRMKPPEQQLEQPPTQQLQERKHLSRNVLACVEVKGEWQWPLKGGEDSTAMAASCLEPSFRQCYGDMVTDEVAVGMITRHNVCLLLRRDEDVKNKTMYVSRTIGLSEALLAFLLLLQLADELRSLKANLQRDQVPSTPVASPRRPRSSTTGGAPPAASPESQEEDEEQQQQAPGPKRRRVQQSKVQHDQEGSIAAQSPSGVATRLGPVEPTSGPSSTTASGIGCAAVGLQQPSSPRAVGDSCGAEAEAGLAVRSFSDVGLTDILVGCGRYGNVLQGCVEGHQAAIKLFDLRFRGAEAAFLAELDMYNQLSELQGVVLPRLLDHGVLAFTDARFLALSDEGMPLPDGPLSEEHRAGMLRAVRKLHTQGVLHNDVRRSNFVVSRDGHVRVVDLELASRAGSDEAMAREEDEVRALGVPG